MRRWRLAAPGAVVAVVMTADALPSCRELDPSDPRGAVLGGLLKAWSALGWVPHELRPAK